MSAFRMGRACALISALALLVPGFFQSARAEIVVGQSVPLTGILASTGKDMMLGVKICFDQVNAKGGVNGQRIRHVVKDDGYKTEETVRLTRELIDKDRAVALIGYAGTGNVAELLQQNVMAGRNVPLIAPYTGGEPLRKPYNPYIFHIRAGYADETEKMVEQFVNTGINRIGIFYQNDLFGMAGLAGVETALTQHGMKIVGRGTYEKGTDKVTEAVKTLAAANPQAVIMVSVLKPAAAFVREYRKAAPGTQIFAISVINGQDLFRLAGPDAKGVGITQVVPSPHSGIEKIVREYRDALKKYAPDAQPSYTSLEEYIGARVLVDGLARVRGDYTPGAVMKALEGVDLDVGGFPVRFGPGNRIGSRFVEVTFLRGDGIPSR